jgi:hypothetical protein
MRILFWLCAVLVVVGGVISTNLWGQLHAERELAVHLRTEVSAAIKLDRLAVPTSLPGPPTTANMAEGGPPETDSSAIIPARRRPTVAEAYAAQAPDAEAARRRRAEQQRDLWKDPGYRKARLAQLRASIVRANTGLADELGLAPAEADALFDLLAEHELNVNASSAELAAALGDSSVRQVNNTMQEIIQRRDAAIAAQLGSVKYAQWQQYGQNSPARSQADAMRSALAQANQPLSPVQLKSLSAVLVTEFRRQREERTAGSTQRLLAAVAPVLSAGQLAIVGAQMEQQESMSRALMRARDLEIASQAQVGQ